MSDTDDDALRWEGDNVDPEPQARGPRRQRQSAADIAGTATADGDRPTGSAALVGYGILVGIYTLFTVGWIIAIVRDPYTQASLLAEIMYQFGEFLAIASPAIWFVAAMALTRGRRDAMRIGWLVLGAAALVPWPFLVGVN